MGPVINYLRICNKNKETSGAKDNGRVSEIHFQRAATCKGQNAEVTSTEKIVGSEQVFAYDFVML